MGKARIFFQFMRFLIENRKWWIIPMMTMLILLGAVIFLTQSSAVAPFIYTLF